MAGRIYKPPTCNYEVEGMHLKTDGTVIHRVSGTMMAGILGISPWSTPFQVACSLLGLAREDISNKPAVKAGIALESKVIKYAGERYPEFGLFIPAEEIYEKREGDHDSWVSDFEDDIFAGHVDGIVMGDDGTDYILEVKTSSNMESWLNGVPEYYCWQVALYNEFITKRDKAYVLLGIVDKNTYSDPNSWIPNENTVGLFEINIDREQVLEKMAIITEWYNTYIVNGITPDYDPQNEGDVEMYEHLVGLTTDVDSMRSIIDELGKVNEELHDHEAQKKALYSTQTALKAKIKDYLTCHSVSSLDSSTGEFNAVLSESESSTIDPNLMLADGIDPKRYTVQTISKRFTVKKTKKK